MVTAIYCCNLVVVAPIVVATLKYVAMVDVHETEKHIDDVSNREDRRIFHCHLKEVELPLPLMSTHATTTTCGW